MPPLGPAPLTVTLIVTPSKGFLPGPNSEPTMSFGSVMTALSYSGPSFMISEPSLPHSAWPSAHAVPAARRVMAAPHRSALAKCIVLTSRLSPADRSFAPAGALMRVIMRAFSGRGKRAGGRPASRVELDVPVEVVAPALVQVARREGPAVGAELVGGRHGRLGHRLHPALVRQAVALAQVAAGAGGQDVGPARPPAARAGDQVVEGQLVRRVALEAVLAAEAVAQEDVEPRERRPAVLGYVLLERHDARQLHLAAGRADHPVVVRDHRDAVEEDGLDGLLPVPDRQRVVAQRLVVGVQDEGRTGGQRQHGVRPAHHGRPGIL